jgi:hypothetical protein
MLFNGEDVCSVGHTEIHLLEVCSELDREISQPDAEFGRLRELDIYAFEIDASKGGVTTWAERCGKLRSAYTNTVNRNSHPSYTNNEPTILPVFGSIFMNGFVLLCCPSFVMSTTIRGSFDDGGNV